MARYKAKDPEKYAAITTKARRDYRDRHPGREYRLFREAIEADPERRAAYRTRYNDWHRANHQKEPARKYALNAERRAGRHRATPAWLSAEQRVAMLEIYREARRRGPEWHVDHIIPLNGTEVSGLHVPWNLRIIRASENLAKGNKLPTAA